MEREIEERLKNDLLGFVVKKLLTVLEFKKEIFKGPKVWCNPDIKVFIYEHPLIKELNLAYPSDGLSISELLTSIVPIYSGDHLLTFDAVAYKGRRSVMRRVGIPTGGVAIGRDSWTNYEGVVRPIASFPDKPISKDYVRAHIANSQVMGPTSADSEGEADPNYALIPPSYLPRRI
ncbi:hypothetical protein PPACK8108_LOCUS1408 [Phakopsora pachyrhizi]|uniref:Uncharacterized protein n=1 Tax=Phakopsora pachyrhizi TaxID=170000 RepID=A0AAV0AFV8_PHAPC|nr:hypothetical protein PPACK8108_LOCUS1408 [Phakopsora pachyrhizi]